MIAPDEEWCARCVNATGVAAGSTQQELEPFLYFLGKGSSGRRVESNSSRCFGYKRVIKLPLLSWTHLCEELVEWMKQNVSPIWETLISFSTTLKEPKYSRSEGTPFASGISAKATKTCHLYADIGLIQLSVHFLVCQYRKRSFGKLAFNRKTQPCNVCHSDTLPKHHTNCPCRSSHTAAEQLCKRLYSFHTLAKKAF